MQDEQDGQGNKLLELRAWLRLLACVNLAESRLRRNFRDRFDTTLARFDVLAQLERMPAGHSMSELSQRLMVTNGNLTPLVDRLVGDGLVKRSPSASDRRVQHVQLTGAGRKALGGMIPAHNAWITEMIGALKPEELSRLYTLLGELKRLIQAAAGGAAPAPERGKRAPPRLPKRGRSRLVRTEAPEAGR
jgi:DNA-binding MarR family transcriptional regulator